MFEKNRVKGIVSYALVICLFVLAFMVIRPVIQSIIYGILLAYIFFPLFRWLNSKINNKTITALIIGIVLLIVIIVIAVTIFSSLFKQAINFYLYFREVDVGNIIVGTIAKVFPVVSSANFPINLASSINDFVTKVISGAFKQLSDFVFNIPVIILNLFVFILVFFYSLRDGQELATYLKSLTPLNKEVQDKFFRQFKDITNSVVVGQVVIGIIQGLFAGIGYFIFGVPNALLLTIITIVVAIIPLGAWLAWVPVDIYLFATNHTGAGLGLLIYGLFFVSTIDNILRIVIISKRTKVNSAIVMVGMIGGVFVFGFLGLIIGPLVLAYVILVIDLYRKNISSEDPVFKKVEE